MSIIYEKPILLSSRGALGSWCLTNRSFYKKIWLKILIKPFVNKFTWHATSLQERNEIEKIFPSSIIEIIPNGIDYDFFQKSNDLTKDKYMKKFTSRNIYADKIIISMGRIQKKKGFDILIDSFVILLNTFPDAKLLIAGEDEGHLSELVEKVSFLNLSKCVFFIGSVSNKDKVNFLSNADVFVLPSHNENFGNVYLESLASGTPIVASKDTPWEIVEDNKCGKWVDNSVDNVCKAMIEVLKMDKNFVSVSAKKLAIDYDWKTISLSFQNIYKGLILKNKK